MKPGNWRLWNLVRGVLRPGPGPIDLPEARRRRREAEYELEYTRSRWPAVENIVANVTDPRRDSDELAEQIQQAFARRLST